MLVSRAMARCRPRRRNSPCMNYEFPVGTIASFSSAHLMLIFISANFRRVSANFKEIICYVLCETSWPRSVNR